MNDDLFIRPLDPSKDWKAFVELNLETFWNSIPADEAIERDDFESIHKDILKRFGAADPNRSSVSIAASSDDAYLGHCWLGLQNDFFTQKPTPWILDLSVKAEYRGHGVGKFLLADCRHRCKMLGFKNVGLQVLNHNSDAVRFYEREGFKLKARSLIHHF